jgi:hypothetical protein
MTRFRLSRFANSFSRWAPLAVVGVALIGLAFGLIALATPLIASAVDDRQRVTAALGGLFALVAAIVAISAAVWTQTSDYRAQEDVKKDLAMLRATLRAIMIKGASLRAEDPNQALTFEDDRKALETFWRSTTAFGFWAWLEMRGSAAPEGENEPWRVFSLEFAHLLAACGAPASAREVPKLLRSAVALEKALATLTTDNIYFISNRMANLAGALGTAVESKDVLLSSVLAVFGTERRGGAGDNVSTTDRDQTQAKFKHLKRKGIDDANVDLFLAVFANSPEDLKAALDAGADVSATDTQVLAKYREQLADFDPADWT